MIIVYLCGTMDIASVLQPADPDFEICRDFYLSCKAVKLKTFISPQKLKKKIWGHFQVDHMLKIYLLK